VLDSYNEAWLTPRTDGRCRPWNQHVVIASGRDYAGVTPVRGIYQGGDGDSADVSVEVTRLR
jgi:transglutaminase-like putative cysteine protease